MRVASFNLSWAEGERASRLGALLRAKGSCSVVFLQEASPTGLDAFCESAGLAWWQSVDRSFGDLLVARQRVGKGRRGTPRAVAIAGTGDAMRSATAFPDVPLPEKILAGWVIVDGRPVTIASYHAPTGVQHGLGKPEQAVRFARWLASLRGTAIFGGDFNTPLRDPVDPGGVRTHWHTGDRHLEGNPGDDLLVGPEPIHPLRDVMRVWLDSHPEAAPPNADGPLAVSYKTRPHKPYRYDAIWATPDVEVGSVAYFYEESRDAGTDHALVVADLDLRPQLPLAELARVIVAAGDVESLPARYDQLATWLGLPDLLRTDDVDPALDGLDLLLREALANPSNPFSSFLEGTESIIEIHQQRLDVVGVVEACLVGVHERLNGGAHP